LLGIVEKVKTRNFYRLRLCLRFQFSRIRQVVQIIFFIHHSHFCHLFSEAKSPVYTWEWLLMGQLTRDFSLVLSQVILTSNNWNILKLNAITVLHVHSTVSIRLSAMAQ